MIMRHGAMPYWQARVKRSSRGLEISGKLSFSCQCPDVRSSLCQCLRRQNTVHSTRGGRWKPGPRQYPTSLRSIEVRSTSPCPTMSSSSSRSSSQSSSSLSFSLRPCEWPQTSSSAVQRGLKEVGKTRDLTAFPVEILGMIVCNVSCTGRLLILYLIMVAYCRFRSNRI